MFNKITEHIYIHSAEPYTDRPNIGLIVGEKHTLLFDAGNSKYHVEQMKRELEEQNLPFPDFVVLSHWHWDHSFGASFWNVPVIAGKLTNEKLKEVCEWKWDDTSMDERIRNGEDIVFCSEMIKREYPDRSEISVSSADIVFEETFSMDLGKTVCHLIHAKGPHSEDSVICYIPSEKFLFLGDANGKDLYGYPWHFEIEHEEDFFKNIDEIPYDNKLVFEFKKLIEGLDFSKCIGGHSVIMTRAELFDFFNNLTDQKSELENAVLRIQKMELYFDIIQHVLKNGPSFLSEDVNIKAMLNELIMYYESKTWLQDYELDERNKLPKTLKRGILSEDGIYNLLSEMHYITEVSE